MSVHLLAALHARLVKCESRFSICSFFSCFSRREPDPQVCDSNTGIYADPRQSICVTQTCGYDLGDCVQAASSSASLESIGYTTGYVGGPQYEVVTNAPTLTAGVPSMPSSTGAVNKDAVNVLLELELASVQARFSWAFNWNMVRSVSLLPCKSENHCLLIRSEICSDRHYPTLLLILRAQMYMYVANHTALRAFVDNDGTIPTSQMGMQQPDTYNIRC